MNQATSNEKTEVVATKSKRRLPRFTILLRRIHLYAGLFLLPWVFLYGLTGAMYNHQGLFPDVQFHTVNSEALAGSPLTDFPPPDLLAKAVVERLRVSAPESDIELLEQPQAEYNNNVILEAYVDGTKHAVHLDPISHSADVAVFAEATEKEMPLLTSVKNIQLAKNPYGLARSSVSDVLSSAGLGEPDSIKPLGWCKLNFLATVDGEQARITYVLRDGHVDVTQYDGSDGMSPRQFLLRLHTSHGQPPHWNFRMFWSLIVDTMAIAMLTWGVTGLVMWWQIKRTRFIGGVVILLSLITACWLYFGMSFFYATTKL